MFFEISSHKISRSLNNPIATLAGQYFDAETGLHYNYYRSYNPWIGRYLTADPVGLGGGINLYTYALSNPVNWYDPFGEDVWIENTTAVNGWHRRIVVDTPAGPYGQSFGMQNRYMTQQGSSAASGKRPALNGEGSGIVYQDMTNPATKEVVRLKTSAEEDRLIEQMLKSELGHTGPYHYISNSCRTYSMRKFNEIKEFIEQRRTIQSQKVVEDCE